MPTTVRLCSRTLEIHNRLRSRIASSNIDLLPNSFGQGRAAIQNVFESSFSDIPSQSAIHPSENGFIFASMTAYCGHHHLCIRPEDRPRAFPIVEYEYKKNLPRKIIRAFHTVDFSDLALQMTPQNVFKDSDFRNWIMPNFTTTTDSDRVVASTLVVGIGPKCLNFPTREPWGLDIPAETLLGKRRDWEDMLNRLDYLQGFGGAEPAQFYRLLKPILTNFVRCFDRPGDARTVDFWKKSWGGWGCVLKNDDDLKDGNVNENAFLRIVRIVRIVRIIRIARIVRILTSFLAGLIVYLIPLTHLFLFSRAAVNEDALNEDGVSEDDEDEDYLYEEDLYDDRVNEDPPVKDNVVKYYPCPVRQIPYGYAGVTVKMSDEDHG
ncbi:uncharacterized protein BDZ99DRAFT_570486 [Mytilinidion resinicola]|uniref:Uncharacterized protein n=1 Tax=Mytilinidion resinicola TaxID=574789 RepID=A0A6A6YSA6_9PEZI|nr:uncharacterized protein BDZ99DRAFT_570486 [Mytilinidion resinicola]KAF2811253.1 hypothetical protein BDZ99DRAFT_570486 [Mytilinidion resinicola]